MKLIGLRGHSLKWAHGRAMAQSLPKWAFGPNNPNLLCSAQISLIKLKQLKSSKQITSNLN